MENGIPNSCLYSFIRTSSSPCFAVRVNQIKDREVTNCINTQPFKMNSRAVGLRVADCMV